MKIISWEKKGNLVRFYLGNNNLKDWYGDDWDDVCYSNNAGMKPYSEYISGYMDIVFRWDINVQEAADDWHYNGNSPYCMNDFKERKAPILVCQKVADGSWGEDYHRLIGAENKEKEFFKIYMGDEILDVLKWYDFCLEVR